VVYAGAGGRMRLRLRRTRKHLAWFLASSKNHDRCGDGVNGQRRVASMRIGWVAGYGLGSAEQGRTWRGTWLQAGSVYTSGGSKIRFGLDGRLFEAGGRVSFACLRSRSDRVPGVSRAKRAGNSGGNAGCFGGFPRDFPIPQPWNR
jgi:hypothetical protein